MKKLITTIALLSSMSLYARPTADIAVLIDTSGSMQGLINQVRDGLWQTLNNLGEVKKDGEVADLRMALYEYGSGVVPAEANYLQMLVPLTTDHTKIAEKLFATKATGSAEFVGLALQSAINDLDWTREKSDFRSIVIAGNETVNQGAVSPLTAVSLAKSEDIVINSIFAGPQTLQVGGFPRGGFGTCHFCPNPIPVPDKPEEEPVYELNPIFSEWQNLAKMSDGLSLNIDHNTSIPHIPSPYDERIIEITEEISETFLPFGENGTSEYERMRNLDSQIRRSGNGSYIGWGDYRSGNFGQSNTASWDLVSALREGTLDLGSIPDEELPEALRGKSLSVKLSIISDMQQLRSKLEQEALDLRAKRKLFVDREREVQAGESQVNFADAIKEIIIKQLEAKGFEVPNK